MPLRFIIWVPVQYGCETPPHLTFHLIVPHGTTRCPCSDWSGQPSAAAQATPGADSNSADNYAAHVDSSGQPHTYPGAPEQDPWSDTPGAGATTPGQFEEELAREERKLFGGEGEVRAAEKGVDDVELPRK